MNEFNVQPIENGILISYREELGGYKKRAFTDDVETYAQDAKDFITSKKTGLANYAEDQAHAQIDNIVNQESEAP